MPVPCIMEEKEKIRKQYTEKEMEKSLPTFLGQCKSNHGLKKTRSLEKSNRTNPLVLRTPPLFSASPS